MPTPNTPLGGGPAAPVFQPPVPSPYKAVIKSDGVAFDGDLISQSGALLVMAAVQTYYTPEELSDFAMAFGAPFEFTVEHVDGTPLTPAEVAANIGVWTISFPDGSDGDAAELYTAMNANGIGAPGYFAIGPTGKGIVWQTVFDTPAGKVFLGPDGLANVTPAPPVPLNNNLFAALAMIAAMRATAGV